MARAGEGMHREDIKAELRKKLGPLSRISESWGLNPHAISRALRVAKDSIPTERKIAQALGKPPHQVWPDRWAADGTPLLRSTGSKGKRLPVAAESQKTRAE